MMKIYHKILKSDLPPELSRLLLDLCEQMIDDVTSGKLPTVLLVSGVGESLLHSAPTL